MAKQAKQVRTPIENLEDEIVRLTEENASLKQRICNGDQSARDTIRELRESNKEKDLEIGVLKAEVRNLIATNGFLVKELNQKGS